MKIYYNAKCSKCRIAKEFLETNAQIVGVSCPFCLQMLTEGILSQDDSNKKNAYDLIELVDQSTN